MWSYHENCVDGYDVLCRVGMMHYVIGEVCGVFMCVYVPSVV